MEIEFNGEPREVSNNATIAQLLQDLRLDPRRVAVEVNRDLVPREKHGETLMAQGDRVEVVTLVGGG